MVAKHFHAWFCVRVVRWLEAESVDTWEGEGKKEHEQSCVENAGLSL